MYLPVTPFFNGFTLFIKSLFIKLYRNKTGYSLQYISLVMGHFFQDLGCSTSPFGKEVTVIAVLNMDGLGSLAKYLT